ncbi:MAG TPA: RNA polymerase factor sigma-54 [Stellaceae bacterium]|jgi:RNA polymerase sigma-54 factor|nr:RNA polymerase factor sigma-54 [Stellaceae bacterium]
MGFSQRLELRQSQALVMTPQLQQAIKMLQLSNLELNNFVDAEIQQNPLLERREWTGDQAPPAGDAANGVEQPATAALPEGLVNDLTPDATEHWHAASGVEGDGSFDLAEEPQAWRSRNGALGSNDRPGLEHTAARPRTLREHVLEQIGTDLSDQGDQLIALHLLDLLDENGYLGGALDSIASVLGCDLVRIEAVLSRLQQFDPVGVFARDLPECLALQLRDRNRLDPAMQALLDHLPLLAARNIPALIRVCRVDAEDMVEMIGEIKSLDPRPGLAFDPPLAQPVVPDILMRAQPEGGWIIELNAETLPRVLVNNKYHARISQATRNKTEKDYLTDRLQAANWLVKSLHQRATTILKVAAEIVRQQDAFFRRGVQSLRPLILRDIAEAIGMHESTVSRVTSNKHMATPRGLYELKYFFTSSIPASSGGDAHSAEAVRHLIRGLIDNEPAGATLSDERIVDLLQRDGVEIARRTVAKYREAMRIPSSVQRRREKLLAF